MRTAHEVHMILGIGLTVTALYATHLNELIRDNATKLHELQTSMQTAKDQLDKTQKELRDLKLTTQFK